MFCIAVKNNQKQNFQKRYSNDELKEDHDENISMNLISRN